LFSSQKLAVSDYCHEAHPKKGGRTSGERNTAMVLAERLASVALIGLSLAPLVIKVDPNLNVVATACLTVFIGCHRSVKPAPPSETMSKEHAMRFPFIGSAVLLSLFLLFKFLPKDLINKAIGTSRGAVNLRCTRRLAWVVIGHSSPPLSTAACGVSVTAPGSA
jgi:hypothetical protein